MKGKPLAIDLFCGLGGWTDGLLAEGFDVIGYDIEEHAYGDMRYQGKLVIQDVTTLHGAALKDATLIVASPPCQEYSYMAMPWKLAKAKAVAIRADTTGQALADLNRLFNECFRLQREASFAAGRHIPLVVENVRGAQPWVGRARWNFGSFYLWGDVPALMPAAVAKKNGHVGGGSWFAIGSPGQTVTGGNPDGRKVSGFRFDGSGRSFQSASVAEHVKVPSDDGGRRTDPGKGARFTSRDCGVERNETEGLKRPGISFSEEGFNVTMARRLAPSLKGAKYERTEEDKRQHIGINRKAASAMIAKIPEPLARHIAAAFRHERKRESCT